MKKTFYLCFEVGICAFNSPLEIIFARQINKQDALIIKCNEKKY